MNVRPFALLGTPVLDATRHKLTVAVEEWRSGWGLERLNVDVDCSRAWEAAPLPSHVQWQRSYDEGGKTVWLAWQADLVRYVQRHVFPPDQRHAVLAKGGFSLAADAAERAIRLLADRIAAAAALPEASGRDPLAATPAAAMTGHGSGAVAARIRIGEQAVHCLLSRECVWDAVLRPMPKGAPQVAGIAGVLSGVGVTLPIEAGQAEVEIGALVTLAVGDVIRLDTSVDQPLIVRGPGGSALFNGYLGTVGKQVAVEIAGRGE